MYQSDVLTLKTFEMSSKKYSRVVDIAGERCAKLFQKQKNIQTATLISVKLPLVDFVYCKGQCHIFFLHFECKPHEQTPILVDCHCLQCRERQNGTFQAFLKRSNNSMQPAQQLCV